MDHITRIHISGFRVLRDVTLALDGLTVLIGDNGTGKTTLLEAFELLRMVGKPQHRLSDIVDPYGGLGEMLSHGAHHLKVEVTVEGEGPRLVYSFTLGLRGVSPVIVEERLTYHGPGYDQPLRALDRDGSRTVLYDEEAKGLVDKTAEVDPSLFAVSAFGLAAQRALLRMTRVLGQIDHQVAWETRPLWQQRELDARRGPRWPNAVEKAEGMQRYGANLANVFQELKNTDAWQDVLERVRLGLGDELRDLKLVPEGRGQLDLQARFSWAMDRPVSVRSLSEGQIAYLLFVALAAFRSNRSVLVFDEPEVHLHPALVSRVAWLLDEISEGVPTIVATHSDRFLDALEDPCKSVVLCEVDERGSTVLRRPDPKRLATWLEDYRGLGAIRADGYGAHVFTSDHDGEADA